MSELTLPPQRRLSRSGLAAALAVAACGGGHNETAADASGASSVVACKVDSSMQPTCTSPEPSYSGTVKDIIASNCQTCHASGGVAAAASGGGGRPQDGNQANTGSRPPGFDPETAHDWSELTNIAHSRTSMMQQLFLCTMPPPDASTLTAADRTTLATWLACGAKDN